MESRATRTLTLLALRCFRRQLHSGLERQSHILQQSLIGLTSSFSPVEAGIYGEPQGRGFAAKLLESEASRLESAEKLSMTDPISRHLLSLLPWQNRTKIEWSIDMVNWTLSRGIQRPSSETIIGEHYQESTFFTDQDFFSRYLQWRRYDQLSHSLESQNSSGPTLGVVDVNGFLSETRQDCISTSLSRSFSCPLSTLHHSMVIPLEASSVKRKRKKKMNKHKQRKLRRRDRHRN